MFCSHFFDEMLERLFHIDDKHHANKPNDANLKTKCGQQSMDKVVCNVLAMKMKKTLKTNRERVCDQSSVKMLSVPTHPLVFGFLVEALLYSLHPQLLLG